MSLRPPSSTRTDPLFPYTTLFRSPEKVKAALLCISAQRDFVSPGSPVRACGWHSALPNITRLVESFRAQHAPIFHSVRLYKADGSNVDACRRQAVEEGLRILMPGTLGAELIDEIKPNKDVRLDPEEIGRAHV